MSPTMYADTASPPLEGKVALVTGAASGLGAALVDVLVLQGAAVVAADLNGSRLLDLAAAHQLKAGRVWPLALDVGDPAAVPPAVASAFDHFGRLDILINNAGTDVTLPIDELTPEQWLRVIGTNLTGPFLMSRSAAPYFRAAGGGQIINIASTAAKRAWPNASAYHASKWGLLGLSHALHAELRAQQIKVTAVIAGGMRTPFLLERFPDLDPATLQDPADVARAIMPLLLMPADNVVAELTVLPMREGSWP